jgi:proline iminopeptidase
VPLPIPAPRAAGFTASTAAPLYWARYGDAGRPVLVILHGGPGADHRYLLPQMLHLAEKYDLLLYDQRGGGRSRASDNRPIGWRDHVADLAAICRECDIAMPSILGYSWGGMLALLYAIAQSRDASLPKPARLVLMSPAPVTTEYRAEFDANLRARGNTPAIADERAILMASDLRERDPDAYRQRIFELGVAGYFFNPANARDLTPFRVVGRVQQSTWDSLGQFDLRPDIARLQVAARVVQGRDDPIPAASSIDVAHALKTEPVFLDRCGHVPYVERPQKLWEAIDPFLASTDAAASGLND